LRKQLPQDVQEVLNRADETLDFESPEYEAAVEVFYKRHLSLTRPWSAKEVLAALEWFAKDSTTYSTMYVIYRIIRTISMTDSDLGTALVSSIYLAHSATGPLSQICLV
jgi:hypothetical protein